MIHPWIGILLGDKFRQIWSMRFWILWSCWAVSAEAYWMENFFLHHEGEQINYRDNQDEMSSKVLIIRFSLITNSRLSIETSPVPWSLCSNILQLPKHQLLDASGLSIALILCMLKSKFQLLGKFIVSLASMCKGLESVPNHNIITSQDI